jgi:glutathione synthase/RimK-type ligase-like ATP-grasp enzyme
VHNPPRASSSHYPSSNQSTSSRRNTVSPERLTARIENLCIKAVTAAQKGDFWSTVDIFKRAVEMFSEVAIAEDERAEVEERANVESETDDNEYFKHMAQSESLLDL